MIIGLNNQVSILCFAIVIVFELFYFSVLRGFSEMTLFDFVVVVSFNICLFVLIVYGVPSSSYNTEKPKTEYVGIGGSMDEFIWGIYYDYKVIVERYDRKNLK